MKCTILEKPYISSSSSSSKLFWHLKISRFSLSSFSAILLLTFKCFSFSGFLFFSVSFFLLCRPSPGIFKVKLCFCLLFFSLPMLFWYLWPEPIANQSPNHLEGWLETGELRGRKASLTLVLPTSAQNQQGNEEVASVLVACTKALQVRIQHIERVLSPQQGL